MFGLIRRLIQRFSQLFKASQYERMIFSFWDGSKIRKVDPLEILKKLKDHPDYNLARDGVGLDEGDVDANYQYANVVYESFGIPPFESDDEIGNVGLTRVEAVEILRQFVYWLENIKKNIKPPPTSQHATA